MRYTWGVCLLLGVAFLAAAGVLGVLAAGQAGDIAAYRHARACLAGAAPDADCLQTVTGAITGVTEYGGKNANYALDVQTASQALHITFSSDSPMLGYAVDGDPAVVTMWRGIAVSVSADGRTEATSTVPYTAFAKDLGECAEFVGMGTSLILGALAIRRNRRMGRVPITRPGVAAALLALGLGSVVVLVGGFALSGKPSRLGPDAAGTGGALVVVLGLAAWLGLAARRRNARPEGPDARPEALPMDAPLDRPPMDWPGTATTPPTDMPADTLSAATPLRAAAPTPLPSTPLPLGGRLQRTVRSPVLRARAANWIMPILVVGVLFGIFLTVQDGPAARAYRHAPACAGESNLATCVGDFTATVNGVRTDSRASNSNYADVSYVTDDGVINTWAEFDGNGPALARAAAADENQLTPLTIKVWRGSIIGAELGSTWHWAQNNPPGNTIPAVFLTVAFAILLLVVRLRIHRRLASLTPAQRPRLITEDAGQVAAAAAAIVLLAYGFWPGAIVAVATLIWLARSVRHSTRARRQALLTSLSA